MFLDHISIICVNHKNTTLITKLYGFFEAKITHLYLKSGMINECKSFNSSYNIVTVKGAAASHVFFHLKAEAVRMGEKMV